jgi:predicted nucleotidyltransferase
MAHNYSLMLKEIRRRYSIDTIYAFGSLGKELKMFAAGAGHIDLSKEADFDVAVKITPQKSLSVRQKSQLTIDLEELFQLTRLDLVVIN